MTICRIKLSKITLQNDIQPNDTLGPESCHTPSIFTDVPNVTVFLSLCQEHYDNTYEDFTYNDFTYNLF